MAIVVTGAAGFIGSALVSFLNKNGITDLILVDDFSKHQKDHNLENKKFSQKIDRQLFLESMESLDIDFIFHIGARTDTTEMDSSIFDRLNLEYSKKIWNHCALQQIPLLYASSAATYGNGEFGFKDDHLLSSKLRPLNPYGASKNDFDIWALKNEEKPPFWVGLKFFNVFGPNEYHKGRMASVVFHAYHQIKNNGGLKLFESHNPNYGNGEQQRDFIYIKDLLDYMWFWFENQKSSGIYNAGSGRARTFNDLAAAIFKALEIPQSITYIPTPEDIRDTYQYFTEANMHKAQEAGFAQNFASLEDNVKDYVQNYLIPNKYY